MTTALSKGPVEPATIVGVAEHGNSAVLVTVAADGKLLDRRRIDLTQGLPTLPYHHEGSWVIGHYLNSSWARTVTLAAQIPAPISGIAIRAYPKLPATTEERIRDARAATIADSAMYREALATAAEVRGKQRINLALTGCAAPGPQ